MPKRLLCLSREHALTDQLLRLFAAGDFPKIYSCQGRADELENQLQRLNPHIVLVGPDILKAADAPQLHHVLMRTHSPPLIFLQTQPQQKFMASAALEWRALDVVPIYESNWQDSLMDRIHLLLPLGQQASKMRKTGGLQNKAGTVPRNCQLLVLGASTGGPQALAHILKDLPADFPVPILIVQHLTGHFTRSLAERLNVLSPLQVREARKHDHLTPGSALIVPGGQQAKVMGNQVLQLFYRPELNLPNVDLALSSAAEALRGRVLAVILTGMGQDGLRGVRALKAQGGTCFVEHASSCVVYGMPRAVVEADLADRIVPLPRISSEILKLVKKA